MLPELAGIDGHRGAYLLRRVVDHNTVEITVLTLWTSIEAIRAFAGDDPEHAVVEPRAREVVNDFDDRVSHHDVLVDTSSEGPLTDRRPGRRAVAIDDEAPGWWR